MASKKVFAVISGCSFLFDSIEQFHRFTFSPDILEKVEFVRHIRADGKNYRERKENARNLAQDIQCNDLGGLSWEEYAELKESLFEIGKRYGLLEEFRENAII